MPTSATSDPTTDPATEQLERVVIEIAGHVQAVGFRYYACVAARKHSVVGWVRNDAEGTVSVMAEGARERLEAFVEVLSKGPAAADVEEVDVRWESASGRFSRFTVEQY